MKLKLTNIKFALFTLIIVFFTFGSAARAAQTDITGPAGSETFGEGVTVLPNGNIVVVDINYDITSPATISNVGAATWGNGVSGTTGAITSAASGGNSIVGTTTNGVSNFSFGATRNRLVVGRGASNTVSILSFTTTATADGDLSNAANWSGGLPDALTSGIIPDGRAMTISSKMSIGGIYVQCGGSLSGGSSSAYIIGSVRKDFCAAAGETFVYPLGVTGSGNLTASVSDNFMSGLPQATSLSRNWALNGSGITTNLAFTYVDADLNGTEANYKLYRRPNSLSNTVFPTALVFSQVNTATNTISVSGISQFSEWSASSTPLAPPTAANVSIGGRILINKGAGLSGATVYLTKPSGEIVMARTSPFGYFTFEDIAAGQTFVISVSSKRYSFTPQVVNVTGDVGDLNFSAESSFGEIQVK